MSPDANMKDIETLITEQGWNDKSLRFLYMEFIRGRGEINALYDFLFRQAEWENTSWTKEHAHG